MNLKAFFVAAISQALELGLAVPDDVLRHATPDVLSTHLPRPLWARLLTACVGAPRVDAQLVVETIGVHNLCEHVPAPILWACIEELALRALGGVVVAAPGASISRPNATPATASRPVPLGTPPPPPANEPARHVSSAPASVGPNIPMPSEGEGEAARSSRMPPSQRFRQSSTGIGRLANNSARRPQAIASSNPPMPVEAPPAPAPAPAAPRVKRGQTESDFDLETYVGGKDDWKNALAVEDEQLVDWSAADETAAGTDELGRKR